MFVSNDSRRMLIEWIENEPFCSSKVVFVKTDEPIGDHYHLKKNEKFMLLSGRAKRVVLGDAEFTDIKAPHVFEVPKGTYHSFELDPDSVLLGVADQPHDPEDEIKR